VARHAAAHAAVVVVVVVAAEAEAVRAASPVPRVQRRFDPLPGE
jgi:hypothetical protein